MTVITILNMLLSPLFAQEGVIEIVPGIDEALISKNSDVEIVTPKFGETFKLGERIEVRWRNRNSERKYVYVVYFYYLDSEIRYGTTVASTEQFSQHILPQHKSTIAIQVYYYDADKWMTGEANNYKYVTSVHVVGVGMDADEYWLRRFDKNSKGGMPTPIPIVVEEPKPPIRVQDSPAPVKVTPRNTRPITSSTALESKKEILGENRKPFSFPFSKPVSVSQWHGYTAFQKPHTGIDFSVAKQDTLAVSDGVVIAKGYDTYYGECLSGGNFLIVQQSNGMFTAYFHLEKSYVDVGQHVVRGQAIAQTGNSGKWNCQPLAYHLHFETRKTRQQSSHVNPVEYIDQDWNLVPTANYRRYPGRLSGDNPHPGT